MAFDVDGRPLLIISCELCFVTREITREVRRLVGEHSGIPPERILLQATHTHSGPGMAITSRNTWDEPYSDILPRRIASAAIAALESMEEAELQHAVVPCEGIGTNRVYAEWKYGPEALAEDSGDYAARTVPLWKHTLPYKNIHEELASALLELDETLDRD